MVKTRPAHIEEIQIYDRHSQHEGPELSSYLDQLKQIVFEEVIERIEKNMDTNAADVLDAAKVKLQNIGKNSKLALIALKPICLLFLVEVYLEVRVNI